MWGKLCSVLTNRTPRGAKHPEPAVSTPQTPGLSNRRGRKEISCPASSEIITVLLGEVFSSWKTEQSRRRQGDKVWTAKSLMSKVPTRPFRAGRGWEVPIPTFGALTSSPWAAQNSSLSSSASLQCVQTVQYLLGQRDADSTGSSTGWGWTGANLSHWTIPEWEKHPQTSSWEQERALGWSVCCWWEDEFIPLFDDGGPEPVLQITLKCSDHP